MAETETTSQAGTEASARVIAVQDNLVTIETAGSEHSSLVKNEIIYICPQREAEAEPAPRLKGEILSIRGSRAQAQVFENTRGVAIGDPVEQSGEMLSVALGPGLLGQVYDGLQNPLEGLALENGTFLPRGLQLPALDQHQKWSFKASVERGDRVRAGDVLGTVREAHVTHKIFAPFDLPGDATVSWILEGTFTVAEPVAELEVADGPARVVRLAQTWPVRRPLPQRLFNARRTARLYPEAPLTTTIRLIDTFFPVAKGGTACIPGPFGAGKTVLQNLIARYSNVDVVVVVACGERAGEVVETITEFPHLQDPHTGGSLMQRTVIVCNTSSMPVAARESSIYTGITIGEYYRQMGLDVLLLADSTSRWAQAMRETSGRMEEIPGEEAFPAYLDSAIKSVYERAGLIAANDGAQGSLTLIGTVSPAGGNLEEPVTQSTLATVKAFLGLSADRAYKRYYPAVDPLISWSRYRDQLRDWFEENLGVGWSERVEEMLDLLREGDDVGQMMQVTGEEGITLARYLTYHKAVLLDMIYLQQDAFDPVDVSVPRERQIRLFDLVYRVLTRNYTFETKGEVRATFTELRRLFQNLNYSAEGSEEYEDYIRQIRETMRAHSVGESG